MVASIIHNEENLCHIADELMALLSKGSELIPVLEVQLKEVRKSIKNVMHAIEQGMRKMVKRLLKKYKYPPEQYESAIETVISQCEMWTDNA